MSCWERVFQRSSLTAADNARIDREVEELRKALYNDYRMSPNAMAVLLGQEVTAAEVRIAADGHDVEVKLEEV